jgi:hypothetical protein
MKNLGTIGGLAAALAAWLAWKSGVPFLVLLPVVLLAGSALVVWAVRAAILKSLPEQVTIEPLPPSQVSPVAQERIEELQRLGFQRLGEPMRFQLGQAADVVPLAHPGESTWATVIHIHSTPPKTAFDLVTAFQAPRAGLTSSPETGSGVLPLGSDEFLQVLPGATAAALLEHHRRALALLTGAGLQPVAPSEHAIRGLLKESLRRRRQSFLRNEWLHTLIALHRTVTKSTPYARALADQPGIAARIKLLASARPRNPKSPRRPMAAKS